MSVSPNMNLPIPVPSQTGGPQYALDEVSCFNIIDSHNHSPGFGSQIPAAALNINTDLPFNFYSITNLKSLKMQNNASSPGTGSLFMQGNDLYWTPGSGGASVQITIGNSIAGAAGNITNLAPPASVVFDSITSTYIFESNVSTPAYMDVGPISIRKPSPGSNSILVSAPPSLPSNYGLQLPSSLPASDSYLVSDSSGNLSFQSTSSSTPAGMISMFGGIVVPSGWLLCNGALLNAVLNPQYVNLFNAIGTYYGGTGINNFILPNFIGRTPIGQGTGASVEVVSGQTAVPTGNIPVASNNTKWITGMEVVLTFVSGFSGISNGTYWVIRNGATFIQLASSLANAIAGVQINVTGTGDFVMTSQFTARSIGENGGTEGVSVQASNLPSTLTTTSGGEHTHNVWRNAGTATSSVRVLTTSSAVVRVEYSDCIPVGGSHSHTLTGGANAAHNNMQPFLTINFIIKY